ncbi:MAG: hypothetical protein ACR2HD_08210 [Solirubrobacteraceae bacterium]|nr:MAG: hypothetical protein DLM63_02355 [Solirubrobacterales bacterium]
MSKEASLRQASRHLGDVLDAGADCLVTPRPLCHLNLDLQQPLAAKVVSRQLGLSGAVPSPAPRLALRLDPEQLGMSKHVVRPASVIDWSTAVVAARA